MGAFRHHFLTFLEPTRLRANSIWPHSMTVLIQRGLEIVPGYTLIRRVGSGMAGEVWVARASGGVHVAIKIIRDMEMVGSKRELGALRIVREVKHTNLCPLIGVWFFDHNGELLNNSATDEILGRESSLLDTSFASSEDETGGALHQTPPRGSDSERLLDTSFGSEVQPDPNGSVNAGNHGHAETAGLTDINGIRGNDSRDASDGSVGPGHEANSMGDAAQMVVAMGLGDRTLYDRLLEMRAPGNMPEGDDLLHLPGGIPAKELLQYISGSASAIDELNLNHNIYHCDIKPQNILIVGGNAQVCDFGLARRVQENRRTQMAFGTPAYGAPEMLFDQTYSKTIDQYSLAITYYELRTGKLPFETTRRSTFLRAKAQGELQIDKVSPAEKTVIAKATHLDSEQRYPSCVAFVDALSLAVYAKPRRNYRNLKWALAAATGLAAIAIPTGMYVTGVKATRAPTIGDGKESSSASRTQDFPKVQDLPKAQDLPKIGELPSVELPDPKLTDPKLIDRGPGDETPDATTDMVAKLEVEPEVQPDIVEMAPSKSDPLPEVETEPKAEPTQKDYVAQATRLAQELIGSKPLPSEDSIALSHAVATRQQELIDELGQEFGKTRKTGWELIEPSLRLLAITTAGQIHWDQNRVSSALKDWLSIQNHPNLLEDVPADWRHYVAEQIIDWLIQNAKVSDQEIKKHRYSKLVVRANGVLRLAERFASDSEQQCRRIDLERFLLAAAQGDTLNGLKIWRSMQWPRHECYPQMGYALASLASARLRQSTQAQERIELIYLRILASNLQHDNSIAATIDREDANQRWTERQACFRLLDEIVQPKLDQLPVISSDVATAELTIWAGNYVVQACKRLTSASHAEYLVQLANIELAASVALMHSKSPDVRASMRLTSAEAFLQSRYEQSDDVPAIQLIGRLRAYGRLVDSDGPMDRLVLARVQDQNGFLSRGIDEMRLAYRESRTLYTSVVDDLTSPPDVRGSAARCRASLLSRIAAVSDTDDKNELLRQANEDAQLAIALPQRWHLDTDDRLMTAAEANLAMVRLLKKLPESERQNLLDDADQYLGQAIAERERRSFPSFQQATLRLNGYLLDLLHCTEADRLRQREILARQWMAKVADTRLSESKTGELPDRTIDSPSSRLRCHWHSMCSMVRSALKEPKLAMAEIKYAEQIALDNLVPSDDRRHFATLILVQLKSPPLFRSIAAGRRPDPELLRELNQLLESIVDPMPDFLAKKKLYQKELAAMAE